MSDVSAAMGAVEIKYLLPQEIEEIPEYSAGRSFGITNEAEEDKLIDQLAESMEREGQLDDIVVRPARKGGSGLAVVFIGHRRKRAATRINEKRSANGAELFRLRARVDSSGGDIKRKAIISNLQRKGLNPMQLAYLIEDVKKEHGWEGFKGSKEVAKYLGVAIANVTQHEKFLTADPMIQADLAQGRLTAQGAFLMLEVRPERRRDVMELAEQEQAKEDLKQDRAVKVDKVTGKPKPDKVHAPALQKAVRKVEDSTEKAVARSRAEVLSWFKGLNGPASGFPDGGIRSFLSYFERWAAGGGSDRTLEAKWDYMTERAPEGTKSSEPVIGKGVEKKSATKKKGKAA